MSSTFHQSLVSYLETTSDRRATDPKYVHVEREDGEGPCYIRMDRLNQLLKPYPVLDKVRVILEGNEPQGYDGMSIKMIQKNRLLVSVHYVNGRFLKHEVKLNRSR